MQRRKSSSDEEDKKKSSPRKNKDPQKSKGLKDSMLNFYFFDGKFYYQNKFINIQLMIT